MTGDGSIERFQQLLNDTQTEVDAMRLELNQQKAVNQEHVRMHTELRGALAVVAEMFARTPALAEWRGQISTDLRIFAGLVKERALHTSDTLELVAGQIEKIKSKATD